MNNLNWERLRIFKAVLEGRSLAEAARRLGLSQPTVGRQVRALEAEIGQVLIDVTPDGTLPTAAGLRLAPVLDEMTRAAGAIGVLRDEETRTPVVRLSCGPWLASLLARHSRVLLGDPADVVVEIASSIAFADLPRREADIAIRNQRPGEGRLVVRKLPDYSCAAYGASRLVRGRAEAYDERRYAAFDWAALVPELEQLPTARWLSARLETTPVLRLSSSVNLLDAVRGGRVLAVLPCFAGDPEPALCRVSEPFVPDYGGHWIVLADDLRRRPHVRRVTDRIVDFLESRRQLLLPGDEGG